MSSWGLFLVLTNICEVSRVKNPGDWVAQGLPKPMRWGSRLSGQNRWRVSGSIAFLLTSLLKFAGGPIFTLPLPPLAPPPPMKHLLSMRLT